MKFPNLLVGLIFVPLFAISARVLSPQISLAQVRPDSLKVPPAPRPKTAVPVLPSWGGVQFITGMRGPYSENERALWAVQKTPATLSPQKFRARVWLNKFFQAGDLKFIFHSSFTDGSPCGRWEVVEMKRPVNRGRFDAVGVFHAPARTGFGLMWVEIQNRNGRKIGWSPKEEFAVFPLTLSCSASEWESTGKADEWKREIYVSSSVQMPREWVIPTKTPLGVSVTIAPGKGQYMGLKPYPVGGIPIRLSLVSSPINRISPSHLSATTGKTPAIHEKGDLFKSDLPKFIATQIAHWRLGESNQLDSSQVVARLNFSSRKKGAAP